MKFSRLKKIGLLVGTVLALTSIQSFGKEWNFESLKKRGIDNSFICYMDGRYITDSSSPQFSFLKKGAKPMNFGIYNLNNHYLVAVSNRYGNIGDEIEITFNNNVKITVYIGDFKKNSETSDTGWGIHKITTNKGCQVEFIVNEDQIPDLVKITGDFSTYIIRYSGGIKSIKNKRM